MEPKGAKRAPKRIPNLESVSESPPDTQKTPNMEPKWCQMVPKCYQNNAKLEGERPKGIAKTPDVQGDL